jgi:uroporphyrinogen-III synthase
VRELAVPDADDLKARNVDAVAVYSPSAAAGLVRGASACGIPLAQLPPVLALGPTTAASAGQQGLLVVARADDPGEDSLLADTARWWRSHV